MPKTWTRLEPRRRQLYQSPKRSPLLHSYIRVTARQIFHLNLFSVSIRTKTSQTSEQEFKPQTPHQSPLALPLVNLFILKKIRKLFSTLVFSFHNILRTKENWRPEQDLNNEVNNSKTTALTTSPLAQADKSKEITKLFLVSLQTEKAKTRRRLEHRSHDFKLHSFTTGPLVYPKVCMKNY